MELSGKNYTLYIQGYMFGNIDIKICKKVEVSEINKGANRGQGVAVYFI